MFLLVTEAHREARNAVQLMVVLASMPLVLYPALHKPQMQCYTTVMPALVSWTKEDQKFQVILSYFVKERPA